jgi:flagellar motor switch/type III secretory pathway protein FliN
MGRVLPEPPGEARVPTSTDAALCAPLLDGLLERAVALPETIEERQVLAGFRFGARAADTRLLTLALEAPEYHVFRLTLDIARGVRQGEMLLCLPVPQTQKSGTDADETVDDEPPQQPKLLCDAVMQLPADLNVAIARVSMPLSRISSFAVGDTLALGHVPFDKAVVQTTDGRTISKGVLGQVDGQRAVRLMHTNVRDDTPRRRASDRGSLDLPQVTANGLGLDLPDVPDPAVGDINRAAAFDLPTIEGMTSLPDLERLPDMSDLPGLADEDAEEPRLSQRG